MPNNYFSIRDGGVITCYASPDFQSTTDVIAALSKAFRLSAAQPGAPGSDIARLLANAGACFQPIAAEEWRARVAELMMRPSGDRRVELNFDTDCARFTDWRAGRRVSITGSLCRIRNAYDETLAKGQRFADPFAERVARLCDIDISKAGAPVQGETETGGPALTPPEGPGTAAISGPTLSV